ncbi:hypothetical protein DXA63_05940 [Segatella copri]|uniref:Uncharacterized protein n=1 Tax=Segatella copri TaxID=165179 RepID=A0AA92UMS9_9BACT|nr:hypothetical protein DXA63_05940 [Segatella copri]
MANISINTTSFIDGILPVYGNPRCNIPVWNEGEKMFISDEYQSAKGTGTTRDCVFLTVWP